MAQTQGFPQLDKLLADQKKALESVPAEQRAEAEAAVKEMEQQFAKQRTFGDLRIRFGDAPVDAALKRAPELNELFTQCMSFLADMQKLAAQEK